MHSDTSVRARLILRNRGAVKRDGFLIAGIAFPGNGEVVLQHVASPVSVARFERGIRFDDGDVGVERTARRPIVLYPLQSFAIVAGRGCVRDFELDGGLAILRRQRLERGRIEPGERDDRDERCRHVVLKWARRAGRQPADCIEHRDALFDAAEDRVAEIRTRVERGVVLQVHVELRRGRMRVRGSRRRDGTANVRQAVARLIFHGGQWPPAAQLPVESATLDDSEPGSRGEPDETPCRSSAPGRRKRESSGRASVIARRRAR